MHTTDASIPNKNIPYMCGNVVYTLCVPEINSLLGQRGRHTATRKCTLRNTKNTESIVTAWHARRIHTYCTRDSSAHRRCALCFRVWRLSSRVTSPEVGTSPFYRELDEMDAARKTSSN